jgi:hypothetical protein
MFAQRRLSSEEVREGAAERAGRAGSGALQIKPFRVGDFVVYGEEAIKPEDIFRRGWATLGFIEPASSERSCTRICTSRRTTYLRGCLAF